jgi:hypothetical protein
MECSLIVSFIITQALVSALYHGALCQSNANWDTAISFLSFNVMHRSYHRYGWIPRKSDGSLRTRVSYPSPPMVETTVFRTATPRMTTVFLVIFESNKIHATGLLVQDYSHVFPLERQVDLSGGSGRRASPVLRTLDTRNAHQENS